MSDKNILHNFLLVLILSFTWQNIFAQKIVFGQITDGQTLQPLYGASVILENSNIGTISNHIGMFRMKLPSKSSRRIKVQYMGYKSRNIILNKRLCVNDSICCNVELQPKNNILSDVIVLGKSKTQRHREVPSAITIIDSQELKYKTATLNEILDNASGIKVAQQGGLGNASRIIIQGMDGKRIGIFINGMPMGNSDEFQLSSIPIDMVDEVEIYKGIIPAWLGGDGLGGAVNIRLKDFKKNHLEMAFEAASYNTYIGSLQLKHYLGKTSTALHAGATMNYAKNNYSFSSPFELGRIIHRDHDTYTHGGFNVGISSQQWWFDQFDLTLSADYYRKEIQGGLMNVQNNIQHAFTRTRSASTSLSLEKSFLKGKLTAQFQSIVGFSLVNQVDTSHYCYDFIGNRFPSGSGRGEIGAVPNDSHDRHTTVRELLNLTYKIGNNQLVTWTTNYRYGCKMPKDELADSYSRLPTSGYPSRLHSIVSGLTHELKLYGGKFTNELGIKLFNHHSEVLPFAEAIMLQDKLKASTNHSTMAGWSEAMALHLLPNNALTLKASVQSTVRMPIAEELFGDGVLLLPSEKLRPERSFNINAGAIWIINAMRYPQVRIGINSFYMSAKDMIKLMYSSMNMAYDNIGKVRVMGIDMEMESKLNRWLDLQGNITWQDARDMRKEAVGGGENFHYRYRIPNMPYLFGNVGVRLHKDGLLSKSSSSAFASTFGFTKAFSYNWEASKHNTMLIPARYCWDVAVHHSFNKRCQLSFEIRNILNRENWAEFRYPMERRTFHLKMKYIINKI
ncbi:TonB-dependent receptor plug domain-containing protein [Hoylesella shahii]|uniref:TonB-dependent receptor n=1 Tax=Hoylesella shahii TaxID=228603 RepID=UPI0028E78CDE|nr:TonB-dependent receptor plug domain-containing protein [Hoylesella shahii]